MSYLALYRKYRPINFDDVYGQEDVVKIIKNAIISNKVSHAYLFSGPRGTGKTTIAKIIARLVNCENLQDDGSPCGKCFNCINFSNSNDIVEIDAASNNGVDEIRELRDKINLVPSNAKYKVYIIDEVHMLTIQAFNALLKTLEEPPSHVIFILATTEPHKIPLTIASRCQKFRFSKIDDNLIVDRLKQIANMENIDIDNDTLFEIARLSDGGMRDAINLLDQLVTYSNSHITIDDIYKINGSISYNNLCKLLDYITTNNKVKIIEFVDNIDKESIDINKLVEEIIIFLKDVILYKNANILSNIEIKNDSIISVSNKYDNKILYDLIEMLNELQSIIKFSSHASILLLTSILKFSDANYDQKEKNISREIINEEKENEIILKEKEKNKAPKEIKKSGENIISNDKITFNIEIRVNNALALASKDILKEIKNKWKNIDEYIYDDMFSVVAGLLKDSSVIVGSEKYIVIANKFSSVVDRINENNEIIQKLFNKVFGYDSLIVAITDDKWNNVKKKYIEDIKCGIKYAVKEEKENINNKNSKTPVDELIDLVGDNIIEYK